MAARLDREKAGSSGGAYRGNDAGRAIHPQPPCRVAAAADRRDAIRQVVDINAGRWTAGPRRCFLCIRRSIAIPRSSIVDPRTPAPPGFSRWNHESGLQSSDLLEGGEIEQRELDTRAGRAVAPDNHLVQMPSIARARAAPPQPPRDHRSELQHPAPDGFVGDVEPRSARRSSTSR